MLACDEIMTLVRSDGEFYTCTVFSGVSWFDKTQVAAGNNGLTYANYVKVRIPQDVLEAAEVTPRTGDHIVRGEVESISTPRELATYSPRKVLSVGDNLRGKFPHLAVVGQ